MEAAIIRARTGNPAQVQSGGRGSRGASADGVAGFRGAVVFIFGFMEGASIRFHYNTGGWLHTRDRESQALAVWLGVLAAPESHERILHVRIEAELGQAARRLVAAVPVPARHQIKI